MSCYLANWKFLNLIDVKVRQGDGVGIDHLLSCIQENTDYQTKLRAELANAISEERQALGKSMLEILIDAIKRDDDRRISQLLVCFGEEALRSLLTPHFQDVSERMKNALEKKVPVFFPECWPACAEEWRLATFN